MELVCPWPSVGSRRVAVPDLLTRTLARAMSRLQLVRPVQIGPSRPMMPAQRHRLCASTAQASQAPLAAGGAVFEPDVSEF